jgi:predicted nucleic acid-binding protein
MVDCMIAAGALRTDASLLVRDADLVRFAGAVGVAIDAASRRAS